MGGKKRRIQYDLAQVKKASVKERMCLKEEIGRLRGNGVIRVTQHRRQWDEKDEMPCDPPGIHLNRGA